MPTNNSDTTGFAPMPFWQWDTTVAGPHAVMDTGLALDTILPLRGKSDTVVRRSLFHNHTLQVTHDEPLPRPATAEPAWEFGILLLLTATLALFYRLRKIAPALMAKTLVDRRAMERVVRDSNLNRHISMFPMGALLMATLCLPVHRMALPGTGLWTYLLLTAAATALYALRNALLRLLGNTFEDRTAINLYITSNYFYHMVEATAICAMTYPFLYLPGARATMLYVMGAFVAVAFACRFMRGAKIFLTLPNSSRFYLFYYLCIVETIPLLALAKWFIVQ